MPFRILVVLLITLASLTGCNRDASQKKEPAATDSIPARPAVADSIPPGAKHLVVVSTNDFHAALQKGEGLASVIRSLRKQYKDQMVYLDAGDEFQGSLEGNMNKGEAVISFFNLLGVDAAAIGNHEFDFGPDVPNRVTVRPGEDGMGSLKARIKTAKYPLISANIVNDPPQKCQPGPDCNALGHKTVFQPRVEIQRGGQKVCVVGATTTATPNITNPDFLKDVQFEDLPPVLTAEADRFRSERHCDWVILNVHEGFRYESSGKAFKSMGLLTVLNGLPSGTFDAVIGGHSHIQVQQVINGMPVVQTGTGAQAVGVLHLINDKGKKSHRFEPLLPVPDTAVAFDVTSLLAPYRQKAFQFKRQVVATAESDFPQDKTAESALGNLMADAVLDAGKKEAGAQFSLMNAGGIRSPLPQGKITYDHVFRLMPFDNNLVVIDMTGAELRQVLSIAFSGALGMPSVSGLRIATRVVPAGQHGPWDRDLNRDGKKEDWERNVLVSVTDLQGRQLQDNQMYKLATNSFLAGGGDYQDILYDPIPPARIHFSQRLVRDILANYFKTHSPLVPDRYFTKSTARIKVVS